MLRYIMGCALGSCFGVALMIAGRIEQGVGLAILGGCLGIILAISGVLYRTTSAETFGRGLLLFLKLTAEKNVPGGERLVPLEDKDIQGRHRQTADPAVLDHRMCFGMKIGAAIALAPAILIATHIQDATREPDPVVIEIMKRLIIGFAFVAFVGGGCGAACGSLTVPGVHRRNISLGTLIGIAIGAGLATAIAPGARVPVWHIYAFGCGAFGWLGMVCGLFSGDNFRSAGHDGDGDRDDQRDP